MSVERRLKPLPSKTEFEGPGERSLVKKLCKPTFSPYPTMFSTIDRNCRHLRHINFLPLHIQIQRTVWAENVSSRSQFSTVNQHFLHIPQCFLQLTGIVVICVALFPLSAHTNTAYRYGRRMGLHAPNFQQTCPRHDFNVNKISEYNV